MKKFEDYIERAGRDIKLTEKEREHMSYVLRQYMEFKPARSGPARASSNSSRARNFQVRGLLVRWYTFSHRSIALAIAALIVTSGGISYAAESALPGDTLYSVKTNINERAKVALAFSSESKANVETELAERRIEEASELASKGKLDANTQNQLATSFETHADAAQKAIETIEPTDSAAAVEISSRFETRLAVHEDILASLQSATGTPATTLSDAVRVRGLAVAGIRARAEKHSEVSSSDENSGPTIAALAVNAIATQSSPQATQDSIDLKTALRMKSAATAQLKLVKKESKDNADNTESDISRAEDLIKSGDALLAQKAVAQAFHAYQDSLVMTEALDVVHSATPALNTETSDRTSVRERMRARGGSENAASARVQSTTSVSANVMPDVSDLPSAVPRSIQIFSPADGNDSTDANSPAPQSDKKNEKDNSSKDDTSGNGSSTLQLSL